MAVHVERVPTVPVVPAVESITLTSAGGDGVLHLDLSEDLRQITVKRDGYIQSFTEKWLGSFTVGDMRAFAEAILREVQ